MNNKVIAFTKKAMTYWRTRMRLHAENELIEREDIKIQRGMRLTITTAILHLLDSSYCTTE
jgi:hypothetical protein